MDAKTSVRMPVEIAAFEPVDQAGVIDVILPIQREEFGVPITLEDQPDLSAIPSFYQSGRGGFWVAKIDGKIVGTIGLKDIGGAQGALRKMFVASPYRGPGFTVAARLLRRLLDAAETARLAEVFLGTTDRFVAAHRFYEKSGFVQIAKDSLPDSFPLMPVDTRFYAIHLPNVGRPRTPYRPVRA